MKQLQRKYGICTETPVKIFLARIVRLFNESTEHKWGLRITQGCSIRCDRSLKTYFFWQAVLKRGEGCICGYGAGLVCICSFLFLFMQILLFVCLRLFPPPLYSFTIQ